MKGHFYRGFILLLVMIVMPSLCWAWSGEVVYVADLDTATFERDSKRVKAFTLSASEHKTYLDPRLYVLEKLKSSDIVFLGMTHKRPPLLEFVRDLVP